MTPRKAAKLAGLAYEPADDVLSADHGLSSVRLFDRMGTQGFMGMEGGTAVIVFRGTKIDPIRITWNEVLRCRVVRTILASMRDVKYDILAHLTNWDGPGKVHAGFKSALDSVSMMLHAFIGEHRAECVHLVGQSLGGGLCHCYAGRLAARLKGELKEINVTTFGCPAVGSAEFCRFVEDHCRSIKNYVYCSDIVPRLLRQRLGYYRPGDTYYFDRKRRFRYHATRLDKLIDRSILRAQNWASGGPRAAFTPEVAHHFVANWTEMLV